MGLDNYSQDITLSPLGMFLVLYHWVMTHIGDIVSFQLVFTKLRSGEQSLIS